MSHTAHVHEIEFEHGHTHHVTSMRVLNTILVLLLLMTGLTVAASRVDLGESLNLWVALGISVFKATLVVAVFMHLWHDKAMNATVLFFCAVTITFFLLFTLLDMDSRAMVDPIEAGPIAAPTIVSDARARAIAAGEFVPGEHEEGGAEHEAPAEH